MIAQLWTVRATCSQCGAVIAKREGVTASRRVISEHVVSLKLCDAHPFASVNVSSTEQDQVIAHE